MLLIVAVILTFLEEVRAQLVMEAGLEAAWICAGDGIVKSSRRRGRKNSHRRMELDFDFIYSLPERWMSEKFCADHWIDGVMQKRNCNLASFFDIKIV